jgi:DNA-binding NarL/FixJ family response regulator
MMLTAFTNDSFIYESITAGAHGYLMKEIEPESLLSSIDDVLAGRSVLSENITDKVVQLMRAGGPAGADNKLSSLSAQETRVLERVAGGRTNKEIADELNLSDNTVKNYLASVFDKLKIRRRSQAAAIWTEHNRG